MTDLECIEYATHVVLRRCREAHPRRVPPDGQTVMEWFAAALNEAKEVRGTTHADLNTPMTNFKNR